MQSRAVSHPAPAHFQPHHFEHRFEVDAAVDVVWQWLNRIETFTQGQPPGYRVEFVGDRFEPGVCTVHHGPFLNFAGVIGDMDVNRYRDLQYFYGSYALSLRLIRPTRLQFWLEPRGDHTTAVRLRVDSHVRPWMAGLWTFAQRAFWPGLGWQMKRELQSRG